MSTGILLSGGMDSIAVAWWKRPSVALNIHYGQASARGELRAAQAVCSALGMALEVLEVDCRSLGSGTLAQSPPLPSAPVPEWWPFRNQLLLTLAAMRAVAIGVDCLLLGTVSTDSVHRDGTESFVSDMDRAMSQQEGAIRVQAPAIRMNTEELIRASGVPRSLLGWAHSCHMGEVACGVCRGCRKYMAVSAQLLWVAE